MISGRGQRSPDEISDQQGRWASTLANGKAVRYRQLVDELLARINSGTVRVGDLLPPEPELAEQFAVSRHTLREALRILTQYGVLQRKPRAGTIVVARGPQPSFTQVMRSADELLQYPQSRLDVQESGFVRADRNLRKLLQCRLGDRWFRIKAVRRLKRKGTAICWLDLYLLPEYASIEASIGKTNQPVYELIRAKFNVPTIAVSVDLTASTLAAEIASALDVRDGDPSLRIVRRYVTAGRQAFQISVSEHPAERYTYRFQLQCIGGPHGSQPGRRG